jgi:hypothetical protein
LYIPEDLPNFEECPFLLHVIEEKITCTHEFLPFRNLGGSRKTVIII